MLVAGIDIGAATAKAIILDNGRILGHSVIPTGHSIDLAVDEVIKSASANAGLSNCSFEYVVSTGYGRHHVPFANKAITEIICHAKGAHYLLPETKTIIDIGGQDSKVIALDENGDVIPVADIGNAKLYDEAALKKARAKNKEVLVRR